MLCNRTPSTLGLRIFGALLHVLGPLAVAVGNVRGQDSGGRVGQLGGGDVTGALACLLGYLQYRLQVLVCATLNLPDSVITRGSIEVAMHRYVKCREILS